MPANQHEIALGLIPGIGPSLTRQLVSYCGSAEQVFKTPKGKLLKIPGIGESTSAAILTANVLPEAERQLKTAEKEQARILFYTDAEYPARFKEVPDAPALFYLRGNANLQAPKTVAIVGTRQSTPYGKDVCEEIIQGLLPYDPLIISGLAYGIDITAHRSALNHGLSTLGVMASGMDIIYPSAHKKTATDMLLQGGILTEYAFGTKPDPMYFPARNRIVAALSDVVIVVEAAKKGGALITAEIANSYNKEVFAVPGNIGLSHSEGCNNLIKDHKAHIYTSPEDIEYIAGWDKVNAPKASKTNFSAILQGLCAEEEQVAQCLINHAELHIDELSWKSGLSIGQVASHLLNMEFKGLIKSLPGKKYKLLVS